MTEYIEIPHTPEQISNALKESYEEYKGIWIEVPGKIIAKQSCKFTKTGIVYTPKEVKEYAKLIQNSFKKRYPDHLPDFYKDTPLEVRIIANFKTPKNKPITYLYNGRHPVNDWYPKKPDLDNITKNVCDALNGIVYPDDRYITALDIIKRYNTIDLLEVSVYPAPEGSVDYISHHI